MEQTANTYESAYQKAIGLKSRGDFDSAGKIFNEIVESDLDKNLSLRSFFHLGEISFLKEDFKRAYTIFEEIVKRNPNHLKCKYYLNWIENYNRLKSSKTLNYIETSEEITKVVTDKLSRYLPVKELILPFEGFENYLKDANYKRFNSYNNCKAPFFREKALEHYAAFTILNMVEEDIFVDVAAAGSPVARIFTEMSGCKSYRQDISYPEGINGDVIGGDASAWSVKEESFTKLALHCSFEHFEENRDSAFIEEGIRILKPGGRLVILPLYITDTPVIKTDPGVWGEDFDTGVFGNSLIYCASNWNNTHGRFYCPESFKKRVFEPSKGLKQEILVLKNNLELDPDSYLKFIFVITKE